MFIVLFVEECYAQVVEVETDDRGYVPEPFAMAVQIVEHQDGVVANVFEDTVGRSCEQTQVYFAFRVLCKDSCFVASAMHVLFFPMCVGWNHDCFWLQMVGKA